MQRRKRGLRFEKLENRQLMHGDPSTTGTTQIDGPTSDHHHAPTATYADVTGDGLVGAADLFLVLRQFGKHSPLGDANGDAVVSSTDLRIIVQAYGTAPHGTGPHGDSPEKQLEHVALLKLFPPEEADAMAIGSGLWSDPAIWSNGHVPSAGQKVWIPTWYSVEIDRELTNPLKWLRVDGGLSFSSNQNSSLSVDTLMGSASSHLHINTSDANVSTRIVIADLGPIDTSWDTLDITRGIVWQGTSEIRGAEKTTWTTAQPAAAGSSRLVVENAMGWKVGDRLVLGGSSVQVVKNRWTAVAEDDDVKILAIDGNQITLDRPLLFSHAAVEQQNPVVINLTRNVVVESENPALDRRGHVMFMHNAEQNISYAAFNELGRTDKSVIATDPDGRGNGLENTRGRYALHFHRTGSESEAVHVTGVAISGSPGWGLVNHDSNVVADNNVSYDVFGAHYVTELGTEHGSFTNNVAVRATGTRLPTQNTKDRRIANDFGHTGEGFWLEGTNVAVTGNVAIGAGTSGFTYFAPPTNDPIIFRNNVSLFNARSLIIWTSRFPGVDFPLDAPVDTGFSEFTGNLLQGTVVMGYSSCLEFRENTIVSFDNNLSSSGFTHTGVNANIHYIDNRITGFAVGILMPTEGENYVTGGFYDNLEVNLMVQNTQKNRYRRTYISDVAFGSRAIWNIEMSISFFSYSLRPAYPEGKYQENKRVPDWQPLFADDNQVLGDNSEIWLDGAELFFEEQGADFKFGEELTRLPDEIRFDPATSELVTGASLNARGLYVGGKALPEGDQFHLAGVRGVLIRP